MDSCKPYVKEIVIVEGKYDKIALEQIIDATIITTDGFGIFKNKGLKTLLQKLAKERGIVILTDSDNAGLLIRGHLTGVLPKEHIRHAYVPEQSGKERRKKLPSRSGFLGVEGMNRRTLLTALENSGVNINENNSQPSLNKQITKADLYVWGLSGGINSAKNRKILQQNLGLPSNISAKMLCQVLSVLYSKRDIENMLAEKQA